MGSTTPLMMKGYYEEGRGILYERFWQGGVQTQHFIPYFNFPFPKFAPYLSVNNIQLAK